ncbi:MAG: hypothetical protein P0Y53_18705 [Candidatus Pseudobacter hemicellulosilyticus]|uniref:Uncharacterized protein n=1 Tax=Candidatus Pseudobacter hemicellulosilyticus TaxID=3121375 RepID=A0AAJ6BFQ5_9BACT|nr:MAG: hypothetical protein P0Y53_18705 [Pseudobacter sp.]
MPHVKCIEPSCPHYITDPCVKLEGLFLIRTDLFVQLEMDPDNLSIQRKLDQLDELMDSQLGLNQEKISFLNASKTSKGTVKKTGALLFTLTCLLGHRNQYSITCEP